MRWVCQAKPTIKSGDRACREISAKREITAIEIDYWRCSPVEQRVRKDAIANHGREDVIGVPNGGLEMTAMREQTRVRTLEQIVCAIRKASIEVFIARVLLRITFFSITAPRRSRKSNGTEPGQPPRSAQDLSPIVDSAVRRRARSTSTGPTRHQHAGISETWEANIRLSPTVRSREYAQPPNSFVKATSVSQGKSDSVANVSKRSSLAYCLSPSKAFALVAVVMRDYVCRR